MTDYTKLKVTDLRDLLTARKLPTNGLKNELITRLTASDAESSPAEPTPAATTNDEYEVDWEEDHKPAAAAAAPVAEPKPVEEAAPAAPVALAAVPVDQDTKPKRKTIASLFESPAPAAAAAPTTSAPDAAPAATKPNNDPSSPSTVTDEAPAPSFAANLPTTSLDDEISRRKKRAERFGLSAEESETLKALERQKRFGAAVANEKEGGEKVEVKGLDEALPAERERKRRGEVQVGRGGGQKRGRFETQEAPARRRGGGAGGRRNAGPAEQGRAQKVTAVDPEERRKAEERKKRFSS